MKRSAHVGALSALLVLATSTFAGAQFPPPPGPAEPLPPPPGPAEPLPPPPPAAPPLQPSPSDPGPSAPAAAPGPVDQVNAPAPPTEAAPAATPAASPAEDPDAISEEEFQKLEAAAAARLEARKTQTGLRGSTGLLRTQFAGSGPVGTFRFSLLGSYFSTSEFLCPQCEDSSGGPGSVPDDVSRVGAHVQLSATLLSYLEAYFGIHSTATSNSRGEPELLQVLGDTTWGLKAFMPKQEDQTFTAGGALEMGLLNGTGGVGIDGTSFTLSGLTTFDLSNKTNAADRVPVRFNIGLSYVFDNSGNLVSDTEAARNRPITRIERFGLNVSKIDRIVPAFGVEGVFEVIRPYFEWSIDVPSNRQDYVCLQNDVHAGDACLDDRPSFTSAPSRMTIGARAYALLDGLALHGALDLGTGGMKPLFWEEMMPEAPWNLYFGISYAADTQPKLERVKVKAPAPVAAAAPPPVAVVRVLEGVVVEAGAEATIVANAVVRYQGRPLTGMVTDERGVFRTVPLDPGEYSFLITAPDYEDGLCRGVVPAAGGAVAPSGELSGAAAPAGSSELGVAPQGQGPQVTRVRCELKAKPRVGDILVTVVDGATGRAIAGATVTPTTVDGRSISLQADAAGSARFTGVPAGPITVVVSGDGYFSTRRQVEVTPRSEVVSQVELFKAGRSNLTLGDKEIKLKKPIRFEPGTANLSADARGLMDELAMLLESKPELSIEIASHTDNSLPFQTALSLTTERASKLRELLIAAGVDAARVSAKGVGGAQPLLPNTTDKNREQNNRIEITLR